MCNLPARLRAEMMGLRKVYEEQTEKAKHEFMHLHSAKVDHVDTVERLADVDLAGLVF